MTNTTIRTRFAPSPTGSMHIGNLRTALYEYLVAKSKFGQFILRIEDTDQERLVEGATKIIYDTLQAVNIVHDEGPDVGGDFGPYIQSERLSLYMPYALDLIKSHKAYYCFCDKKRLDQLKESNDTKANNFAGYDRHCRDLSDSQVKDNLENNKPFVIRQKMPLDGKTTFEDSVYGEITVDNTELEDQILIKSDGFPTYNFANVIDDHLMNITHVVRGSEYLSSTPKYNLLYNAFNWEIPVYIHLPLIMGKNADGSVSKLSKRHGSTGFSDLMSEGYLPEAIINYIALLGWCPKDNVEIMSMDELKEKFRVEGISKSPAVFDYDKLDWVNAEYIKNLTPEDFHEIALKFYGELINDPELKLVKISTLLQTRVSRFTQIKEMTVFFKDIDKYDTQLFVHKKMKTTKEDSLFQLNAIIPLIENISDWSEDNIHSLLNDYAQTEQIKKGQIMWPLRTALSGLPTSPGGATDLLYILGKSKSLKRIKYAIDLLKEEI